MTNIIIHPIFRTSLERKTRARWAQLESARDNAVSVLEQAISPLEALHFGNWQPDMARILKGFRSATQSLSDTDLDAAHRSGLLMQLALEVAELLSELNAVARAIQGSPGDEGLDGLPGGSVP